MTSAAVTPIAVQVSADLAAPVIAEVPVHALLAATIAGKNLEALPPEWKAPGVYVLLGALDGKTTEVYVGKAVSLRQRLFNHRSKPKIDWWQAVAIKRDTTHGFNSAEIGYLEGRLAAELGARPAVTVHQGKKDQDHTLPEHQRVALDAFMPSVLAILRLTGLDLQPPIEGPPPTADAHDGNDIASPAMGEVTIEHLLRAGLLKVSEPLRYSRKGRSITGRLTTHGEIVVNGVTYPTPSQAAEKGMGVKGVNGWINWRTQDGQGPSLDVLRKEWLAGSGQAE